MPEGHAVHRLAGEVARSFKGRVMAVTSPQGRFAVGAALLDGHRLVSTQAHGKHLLVGFAPAGAPAGGRPSALPRAGAWLHVHLGLYGKWAFGEGEVPPQRGALRLRLVTIDAGTATTTATGPVRWAELRGPTACEVLDAAQVDLLHARLGPDPLRADADPGLFTARVQASRTSVAALLMRQEVLSGVGNIYRAEVLFRARLWPFTPGRELSQATVAAIWDDLVVLMRAGVRAGRIVTTSPADRGGDRGRSGAFYVYGRLGLPCRLCGTPVLAELLAGRMLSWCPHCQPAPPDEPRRAAESEPESEIFATSSG